MELYGGIEGIERLLRGLHSDYIMSRESPFGHLWSKELPDNRFVFSKLRLNFSLLIRRTYKPVHLSSSSSLSKFNLPLTETFTWAMPPGPYKATTCRRRGLNYGTQTYFFDNTRTWRASPMSDQPYSGATSETAQTRKTIHTKHTLSSQQGEYGMMITTAKWYSGTLGGLKFPDICLIDEEKPRKNLSQETCPDRGSNPGPLRDKRACYHLLHSGGLIS